MQKFIILILGLLIILAPSMTLAAPIFLDQYGEFQCHDNCSLFGLENGQTQFFNIPADPSHLSGYIKKTLISQIFYRPYIKPEEMTNIQASIADNEIQLNGLTQNPEIDARFCQGKEVFAKGWYDSLNRSRIKPVCTSDESIVKADKTITLDNYYKPLPNLDSSALTKVYHFNNFDNKVVFSDRPDISELVGKIIKGITDTTLYYINKYDEPLTLRPVTAEKASFYAGADYQSKIINFDDAIIFTYKIGKPL